MPFSMHALAWSTQLLSHLSPLPRVQVNYTALSTILPIEIDAWIAFNEATELTQYDVTLRWFAWTGMPDGACLDASHTRLT